MKEYIEKAFGVVDKIKQFDGEAFLQEARSKIDEISSNPGQFALTAILQLKLAYEMIDCYFKKECKLPWKTLIALIGLFLYFINPADIIPDFLPGVGYLDDAVALGIALKFLRDDLKEYAQSKGLNLEEYGLA
ncbi:YkvA family protein [Hippea sp. KM1]|uniref:YkvA family protein n=1 Tax=Hippea sp. KM1 TaxID=944481 RepID=UPI00046C8DBB|nr:DUF1232 domain-containing protein [Hippea sp. KM1]